jgi:hypothetical protein
MSLRTLLITLLLIALIASLMACGDSDPVHPVSTEKMSTCQGCHTDASMLQETVLPDPPLPESEGEG